jgi:poly(ADP-ribose) glycohydrolase ARH3
MAEVVTPSLLSKFRGSLIGALIGDCLGAPFEEERVSTSKLEKFINDLLNKDSRELCTYTDDTSMIISVAKSLVENGKVDPKDMAKKFVSEYFTHPNPGPKLGYGVHVIHVFHALRNTDFKDVFLPASKQFLGAGSYGNGAAMRIAPIALFGYHETDESLKNAVEQCSKVTHTHPEGYNGAILQCFAVHAALKADPSRDLDPVDFLTQLKNRMKKIETKRNDAPYCESLNKIKDIYLKNKEDISASEIAKYLGNEISALRSVPTAVYSFLRGMKPIPDFECSNPFVRTIYFAISVGGDTDTIASMAASIAGAYYGVEIIPGELQRCCEGADQVSKLAEQLHAATQKD